MHAGWSEAWVCWELCPTVAREHEATGCKYHTAGAGRTPSRLGSPGHIFSGPVTRQPFPNPSLSAPLMVLSFSQRGANLLDFFFSSSSFKTRFIIVMHLEAGVQCMNLGINAFKMSVSQCLYVFAIKTGGHLKRPGEKKWLESQVDECLQINFQLTN